MVPLYYRIEKHFIVFRNIQYPLFFAVHLLPGPGKNYVGTPTASVTHYMRFPAYAHITRFSARHLKTSRDLQHVCAIAGHSHTCAHMPQASTWFQMTKACLRMCTNPLNVHRHAKGPFQVPNT